MLKNSALLIYFLNYPYSKKFTCLLYHNFNYFYKKLLSLNFPFECFISKHIASYYSSFFYNVNMFMKIADILVFESSIAINNSSDQINHLRFLRSIALVILVENENKFLSWEY